jgi:TP901 family phage tail tape measure protein
MADDFKVVFELDVQDAISSANKLSQTLGTTVAALNSLEAASKSVQGASSGFQQASQSATKFGSSSSKAAQQASRAYSNLSVETDAAILARQRESKSFSSSLQAKMRDQVATENLKTANENLAVSLPTLRYALYDVSNSLFIAGAAFGAVSIAAVGAAISWERSFANVIRTTGVTGSMVDDLRDGLARLTREIPQSFGNLTEIAALGGQLGIAAGGIVDFTRVVSMLTTTTDLSAEAAGTALGRFSALLDVAPSEFEALASAILRTGINSVATETQIVNIATQISSMGDFAGLSAHEVVGLSAALASVGAQPELSRGTITRVFVQMSRAIASGGERLEEFARLSGVTGEVFAKSFGTDQFGGQFQTFLANIGKEGGNAVQVLNDLGITSVRDVPLLLRLAGATDTVTNAFADAAQGWEQATELQDNYGIIVETTAEKLNLLWNAVTELFATLGAGATGPLSEFITSLQKSLNGLTEFLNTDSGQRIALLVIGLTALVAVVLLFLGVVARAAAGVAALRTVVIQLTAAAGGASTATGITAGVISTLGLTSARTTATVKLLGLALKALAAATIVFALPQITTGLKDLVNGAQGIDPSDAIASLDRIENDFFKHAVFSGLDPTISRGAVDTLGFGFYQIEASIKDFDEAVAGMVGSGDVSEATELISEFVRVSGLSNQEEALKWLPSTQTALTDTAAAAGETTQGLAALKEMEELTARATEELAESFGLSVEDFESYEASVRSSTDAAIDLSSAIGIATKKGIFSLEDFNTALFAQVTALENWEKNLNFLLSKGIDFSIVQELIAIGPETGGQMAQGLVDNFGTTIGKNSLNLIQRGIDIEESVSSGFIQNQSLIIAASQKGSEAGDAMFKAITAGASEDKIAAIVAKYDIRVPVGADIGPANRSIYSLFNRWNGRTINLRTAVSGKLGSGIMTGPQIPTGERREATGGYISGPGTGTSDSIPARLSDGEYVIRAASVRKYGSGMFDQLNRGVARFARGGPVGGGSAFGPQSSSIDQSTQITVQGNVGYTPESFVREITREKRKANAGAGIGRVTVA